VCPVNYKELNFADGPRHVDCARVLVEAEAMIETPDGSVRDHARWWVGGWVVGGWLGERGGAQRFLWQLSVPMGSGVGAVGA
jgi:hypothetical protein